MLIKIIGEFSLLKLIIIHRWFFLFLNRDHKDHLSAWQTFMDVNLRTIFHNPFSEVKNKRRRGRGQEENKIKDKRIQVTRLWITSVKTWIVAKSWAPSWLFSFGKRTLTLYAKTLFHQIIRHVISDVISWRTHDMKRIAKRDTDSQRLNSTIFHRW